MICLRVLYTSSSICRKWFQAVFRIRVRTGCRTRRKGWINDMKVRWVKKAMPSSSMTAWAMWATTEIINSIFNQRFYSSPNRFFFNERASIMLYWLLSRIQFWFLVLDCQIMHKETRSFPSSFISHFQFQWYFKVLACCKVNVFIHQQVGVIPTLRTDVLTPHEVRRYSTWKIDKLNQFEKSETLLVQWECFQRSPSNL